MVNKISRIKIDRDIQILLQVIPGDPKKNIPLFVVSGETQVFAKQLNRHIFGFPTKNTAKRNMSSAVCALSMYSRLCMKMSSFLFVRTWAMRRIGIPFPV